jgi:hypothetical protein
MAEVLLHTQQQQQLVVLVVVATPASALHL